MKIEIWSDFACPFCYIGETAMMKALDKMALTDQTEIVFKSFQLDPNATSHPDEDIHTLISKKYQISYEQAKASNANIVKMAAQTGLTFDFDALKPNNTAMAHKLMKFAQTKGQNSAITLAHALFKAYFELGIDIGNRESLINVAQSCGYDIESLERALDEAHFNGEVITDQAYAFKERIQSVPYFVIDGKYAISGAQSELYFEMAFNQILNETKAPSTTL